MNSTVKHAFSVSAIAAFLFLAVASGDSKTPAAGTSTDSTKKEGAASSEKSEAKENWEYSQDEDKMSNEKQYFASSTSTNTVEFKFPYNGGSSMVVTVRNMGKENEVVIQVTKGQFMSSIGSSQEVRVKFDDEQPSEYGYNSTDDGSSNVIFLENSSTFLSKLKTAKKLMIEAPFFQEGNQVFNFDVAGLKWDK